MRFDKDTKVSTAHRWWKNGDYPGDEPELIPVHDDDGTEIARVLSEGKIVKHYAGDQPPLTIHDDCGSAWGIHGWVNGEAVCPGNWVVTASKGHYTVHAERSFLDAITTVDPKNPSTLIEHHPDGEKKVKVYYYADCAGCKGRKRFTNPGERDGWAQMHQTETRHAVDTYEVER